MITQFQVTGGHGTKDLEKREMIGDDGVCLSAVSLSVCLSVCLSVSLSLSFPPSFPHLIRVVSDHKQNGGISEGQHIAVHGTETDAMGKCGVDEVHVMADCLGGQVRSELCVCVCVCVCV